MVNAKGYVLWLVVERARALVALLVVECASKLAKTLAMLLAAGLVVERANKFAKALAVLRV